MTNSIFFEELFSVVCALCIEKVIEPTLLIAWYHHYKLHGYITVSHITNLWLQLDIEITTNQLLESNVLGSEIDGLVKSFKENGLITDLLQRWKSIYICDICLLALNFVFFFYHLLVNNIYVLWFKSRTVIFMLKGLSCENALFL